MQSKHLPEYTMMHVPQWTREHLWACTRKPQLEGTIAHVPDCSIGVSAKIVYGWNFTVWPWRASAWSVTLNLCLGFPVWINHEEILSTFIIQRLFQATAQGASARKIALGVSPRFIFDSQYYQTEYHVVVAMWNLYWETDSMHSLHHLTKWWNQYQVFLRQTFKHCPRWPLEIATMRHLVVPLLKYSKRILNSSLLCNLSGKMFLAASLSESTTTSNMIPPPAIVWSLLLKIKTIASGALCKADTSRDKPSSLSPRIICLEAGYSLQKIAYGSNAEYTLMILSQENYEEPLVGDQEGALNNTFKKPLKAEALRFGLWMILKVLAMNNLCGPSNSGHGKPPLVNFMVSS